MANSMCSKRSWNGNIRCMSFATRDYILDTILSNFKEGSSVIISTHLISDIERILDEVVFIDKGKITLTGDADKLRSKEKASIDEIFRRMFNAKKTN